MTVTPVSGFSKKTKEEKIDWIVSNYLNNDSSLKETLTSYWHTSKTIQKTHDEFIENTISNYYLPLGIAPNFLINDQLLALPLVIEESSVVAAASNAAKFWLDKGGFKASVLSTLKNGQVHLNYYGDPKDLTSFFNLHKNELIESVSSLSKNMEKRGGGLREISLVNATNALDGYFQLHCYFETKDAMGANYINSCLEQIAKTFIELAKNYAKFNENGKFPEVVMSILSNYVPECIVRAEVSCPIADLDQPGIDGKTFAEKFVRAIAIAKAEPRRAVTHNKGIMNGIDALIVATGNDFRAVEAGVHAYASKDGHYQSLTNATIENEIFKFWIEIPLAIGTVGGLTALHPLVKLAFNILQNPNAEQLMKITAVMGLAQNFAAVRSLITTGIQKGHMKMHLMNILNQFNATPEEIAITKKHFVNTTITHSAVQTYLNTLRNS